MAEEPRRVVIVEDDASLRRAMQRLLAASGLMVSSHESAESCLGGQDMRSADGFVIDLHLPGVSGLELVSRLPQGLSRRCVLITAYDDAATRELAGQFETMYLVKPFEGDVLLQAVAQVLDRPLLRLPPTSLPH